MRTALAAANVDQAKGNIDGPRQAYTIGANDQIFNSADYKPVIVGYKNGAPVRVQDVATVIDGVGEHQSGRLVRRHPRRDREHPAAAGRQHHQRGRPHQGAAAATEAPHCRLR